MRILLAILLTLSITTGCMSCNPSKDIVEKEEKSERVLTIYYHCLRNSYNTGDYVIGPMHDSLRGPMRVAMNKLVEATNGRIQFRETSDISACDILVCYTSVNPSVLAFWDPSKSILAVNVNASGGNIQQTLLHELGHMLGLPHSGNPSSFMYWTCGGSIGMKIITDEDVENLMRIIEGK